MIFFLAFLTPGIYTTWSIKKFKIIIIIIINGNIYDNNTNHNSLWLVFLVYQFLATYSSSYIKYRLYKLYIAVEWPEYVSMEIPWAYLQDTQGMCCPALQFCSRCTSALACFTCLSAGICVSLVPPHYDLRPTIFHSTRSRTTAQVWKQIKICITTLRQVQRYV